MQQNSGNKGQWSRRRMLALGAAGAGWTLAPRLLGARPGARDTQTKAAALSPELEQGPFYVGSELMRSNIREAEGGLPLQLHIAVVHAVTGRPVPGAAVDIWHCNAVGLYSGFTKSTLGPPPGGRMHGPPDGDFAGGPPPGPPPDFAQGPGGGDRMRGAPPQMKLTDELTFLRGMQLTAADGTVAFETIYPGWYSGRDIHIHLKVHENGHVSGKRYEGGHVCHTGQIAFPDEITDAVAKLPPYATHRERRTLLEEDHVFGGEAAETMLSLSYLQQGHLAAGMRGSIVVAIDPDATPKPTGFGAPPGPGDGRAGV